MNRKLLRGLVFDACGRGDRIPQRLRYLVEPIALAGHISHVLRLFFVDHLVPLSGVSPANVHYDLLTGHALHRGLRRDRRVLPADTADRFPAWPG